MGHFALFKCLHELKRSNTSWHTLCFLPPLVYITTMAVLIVSSPHTKSHQWRPYTVETFRGELIKTNAPAYPSLAVISLYKLTHIWLAFNYAFNFFHLFSKCTDSWLGARHGFRCWAVATEKAEFSLLAITFQCGRQIICKYIKSI